MILFNYQIIGPHAWKLFLIISIQIHAVETSQHLELHVVFYTIYRGKMLW